jgi:hypothetical protein
MLPKTELLPWFPAPELCAPPAPTVTVYEEPPTTWSFASATTPPPLFSPTTDVLYPPAPPPPPFAGFAEELPPPEPPPAITRYSNSVGAIPKLIFPVPAVNDVTLLEPDASVVEVSPAPTLIDSDAG